MQAQTLKILRELNNYTQSFVAEDVLQISQTTYARLEKNASKLTADQAKKLSALYNVTIGNLLSSELPVIFFRENSIRNVNLPNSNTANNAVNEELLSLLKAEIDFLKKQNTELKKLLGVV